MSWSDDFYSSMSVDELREKARNFFLFYILQNA